MVAALVVSPWGLAKHPVWSSVELYKVFCAVVAFLIWAAVGWFTFRQSQQRWWLAALCPAGLALLIGFAIPNLVVDSKQPQSLVDTVREPLQDSRFVLANNFAQWLAEHRQQGRVSLVILLSKRDDLSRANLPEPDSLYIQGRLAYLQYLPK